ncbi:MAG: sensor histidine kinase [Burkholderiales bacterium]|nr:sensor histidine kinase [Burkholderiales bacterium]
MAQASWPRIAQAFVTGYHRYASWLVSISWKRFILLAILLMIVAGITSSLPPFRYSVTETVDEPIELPELPELPEVPEPPAAPAPPKAPAGQREPLIRIERPRSGEAEGLDISIDERGIRIRPRETTAPASPPAPPAPAGAGQGGAAEGGATAAEPGAAAGGAAADPCPGGTAATRAEIDAAVRDARRAAREAVQQARQAIEDAGLAGATRKVTRKRVVHWGDFLPQLALIWIFASAMLKLVYKGRIQAEAKAAQAAETAESESLKRQVVEARMAAMQAQVEPHFLFNTLASIDHLIETDPPRASQMQKNLIALLRASMPTLREASGNGGGGSARELGRELAVIRPYLQILEVRMEERLTTEIDVPEGLLSAEFPPMMIQTLVENAIKHGLEPKPEGGHLAVKAQVVHGKLAVSVADSGMGFGRAPTAGTGVGLANIRERLQLLYGGRAALTVTENPGGGTVATITVPYRTVEAAAAEEAAAPAPAAGSTAPGRGSPAGARGAAGAAA